MGGPTREREPDELCGDALRSLSLIAEGAERMDAGDPLGVDLVAQSARRLVGPGRGNDLLKRVQLGFGIEVEPAVPDLTAPVKPGVPNEVFAFGAFPLDDSDEEWAGTYRPFGMDDFLSQPCVLLADTVEQVVYTWIELLKVVADKLSIHSDDEIPHYVDEMCGYQIGETPVLRLILRTLGALLFDYGAELLDASGCSSVSTPRLALFPIDAPWIGSASVRQKDGFLDIRVNIRYRSGGTELLSYQPQARVDWLFDPPRAVATPQRWPLNAMPGRNDLCPCGSGTKYKRCHGAP